MEKGVRVTMFPKMIILVAAIIFTACAGTVKKAEIENGNILDAYTLRQMHKDHRYTHFYYSDGSVREGLLLKWDIDSIKIKTYGEERFKSIPTANIDKIEIVVGNKLFKYLALAVPLGLGAYLAVDPPPALGGDDEPSLAVLITPIAIVSAMIYGSTKEKRATYTLPPGFTFDYEKENKYFDLLE